MTTVFLPRTSRIAGKQAPTLDQTDAIPCAQFLQSNGGACLQAIQCVVRRRASCIACEQAPALPQAKASFGVLNPQE